MSIVEKSFVALIAISTMAGSYQLNATNVKNNVSRAKLCRVSKQLSEACALWQACQSGDMGRVLVTLVETDDECMIILAQDVLGKTALHHAAEKGYLPIVKVLVNLAKKERVLGTLIAKRTTVNNLLGTNALKTALDLAKKNKHKSVVEFLKSFH